MKAWLEELLREKAQQLRFEAEKTRAQKERRIDAEAYKSVDETMELASDRRVGADIGLWKLLRLGTQYQAESRGFLSADQDGKWKYNSGKVDKHERPAEKLVNGDVKGDRWKRFKSAKNEAQAVLHYGSQHYEEVVYDAHRTEAISEGGIGQQKYDEWRDAEIRHGIKDGFIELRPNGKIRLVDHGSPHNRPAEKLLTGRVKGKKRDTGRSM